MSDDQSTNGSGQKTWLERLSQSLSSEPKNREQLLSLLRDAKNRDIIDGDDLTMIEGVLQVSEMQVRDIMIPRAQMVIVKKGTPLEDFLPVVIESAHSRFPVVGDDKDEVTGILLAKDLITALAAPTKPFNIDEYLRQPVFVPESKRLDVMLKEFRVTHNHMAIVIDEYGGVAGLVTIEDVLEQIVGDIEDETDAVESFIKQRTETEFTLNALTPIDEFNEFFNAKLSEEEFDTVGGLVTQALGHLPKRGESVDIDDFHFKILHSDSRRIRLLQVTLVETQSTDA